LLNFVFFFYEIAFVYNHLVKTADFWKFRSEVWSKTDSCPSCQRLEFAVMS